LGRFELMQKAFARKVLIESMHFVPVDCLEFPFSHLNCWSTVVKTNQH
jgi:hypothetical protein